MISERECRAVSISVRGEVIDFRTPLVMGIVNVTPDSFYSHSRTTDNDSIRRRVAEMLEQQVDWLDVGGYSSRPGAAEVSADEEYRRVALALEIIRTEFPDTIVSVDTFRAEVARRVIAEYGVDIINDIGGGTLDEDIWDVVAENNVAYVLMHTRGTPETMQSLANYDDITAEVFKDLAFKIDALRQKGVANIIIDPGFGFAKTREQNFELLSNLDVFSGLGCPVLAGMSRKTMIWKTLGVTPEESCNGTTALNMVALMNGADILRVHDVRAARETVKLYEALKNNR